MRNMWPAMSGEEKRSKAESVLDSNAFALSLPLCLSPDASHLSSPSPGGGGRIRFRFRVHGCAATMTAGYIVGSLVGSFAIAYLCDTFVSDMKAFGGSIPKTVSDKEWWKATDTKFQAWPRTAGPPVIMNPISRQNFIVKSTE